ncbi:hypothetical protein Tco_1144168 [Tanacetum coccineum]
MEKFNATWWCIQSSHALNGVSLSYGDGDELYIPTDGPMHFGKYKEWKHTPTTTVLEKVLRKLKFNSIKDAKLLMEAVEKRFGGNATTKKTQRNLLKQQYENFTAPSSEMLDQTFDRL